MTPLSPPFHSTSCPLLNRHHVSSTASGSWRYGAKCFFSIVAVVVFLAFFKKYCKCNTSHFRRQRGRRQQRVGGRIEAKCSSKIASLPIRSNAYEPVVAAPPGQNLLADFTCAICLHCPNTCEEIAKISGCAHEFCFDCIDQWAKTENRCPCCKARFRTIERVIPLLEAEHNGVASELSTAGTKTSQNPRMSPSVRRQMRERDNSAASEGAAGMSMTVAAAAATTTTTARVNSRILEDRDQSVAQEFSLAAILQGRNRGEGEIQIVRLTAGEEHPILQLLEFVMNDISGNGDDVEPIGFSPRTGRASIPAMERSGRGPRETTAASVESNATNGASTNVAFHIGSNDGSRRSGRMIRGASTRRRRKQHSTRTREVRTREVRTREVRTREVRTRQQVVVSLDNGFITRTPSHEDKNSSRIDLDNSTSKRKSLR